MNHELLKSGTKQLLAELEEIVELARYEKLETGMVNDSQGKIEEIMKLFTDWRGDDVLD